MRNNLRTPFWRAAYRSLPDTVRGRYLAQIERAERWESGFEDVIESLSRARSVLARLFNTAKPHSAH